jgi:hypothetical protein
MAGRLLANKVAVKSCKLASPKRCKKACVLAKRNRRSSPANSVRQGFEGGREVRQRLGDANADPHSNFIHSLKRRIGEIHR